MKPLFDGDITRTAMMLIRERPDALTVGLTIAGGCIMGGLFLDTYSRLQPMPQAKAQPKTLVTIVNMDTFDVLVDRALLRSEYTEGDGDEPDYRCFTFQDGSYLNLDLKIGNYRIIRKFVK
jgi:hypothetical protein